MGSMKILAICIVAIVGVTAIGLIANDVINGNDDGDGVSGTTTVINKSMNLPGNLTVTLDKIVETNKIGDSTATGSYMVVYVNVKYTGSGEYKMYHNDFKIRLAGTGTYYTVNATVGSQLTNHMKSTETFTSGNTISFTLVYELPTTHDANNYLLTCLGYDGSPPYVSILIKP